MTGAACKWVLPITSVNEDKLLKCLGLSTAERNEIEGLHIGRSQPARRAAGATQSEQQQRDRAIARLAADPPPMVGAMQRRTAKNLLRPYPLGLRFSGKNMAPIPAWLAGSQGVW